MLSIGNGCIGSDDRSITNTRIFSYLDVAEQHAPIVDSETTKRRELYGGILTNCDQVVFREMAVQTDSGSRFDLCPKHAIVPPKGCIT